MTDRTKKKERGSGCNEKVGMFELELHSYSSFISRMRCTHVFGRRACQLGCCIG